MGRGCGAGGPIVTPLSIATARNHAEWFRTLEIHKGREVERAQRQQDEAKKAAEMWEGTLKMLEDNATQDS